MVTYWAWVGAKYPKKTARVRRSFFIWFGLVSVRNVFGNSFVRFLPLKKDTGMAVQWNHFP
jgi:hypothetical protein